MAWSCQHSKYRDLSSCRPERENGSSGGNHATLPAAGALSSAGQAARVIAFSIGSLCYVEWESAEACRKAVFESQLHITRDFT